MGNKQWPIAVLFFAGLLFFASPSPGQKVKFATGVRVHPAYYLPMMAAEEKGMWKANGLEGEWVPFTGTDAMMRAVAAEQIQVGGNAAAGLFPALARGIPLVIVSDLSLSDDFIFWVRADSRIKEPRELRGAKIGVARFGGTEHAYAQVILNALGLQKEVRFLAIGGVAETVAALKTGAIDALMLTLIPMIKLKVAQEVRPVAAVSEYRPRPWAGFIVYARKDFAGKSPETLKRVVNTVVQASNFVQANTAWALARMKAESGYSEEEAQQIFSGLNLTKDGKIERKALENVRSFLVEYGLVPREKAPAVDDIFTDRFFK